MSSTLLKVLCVEDDEIQRKLVRDILVGKAVVDEVDDGKKAIERVRNNNYDVILMDLKLAGLGGVQASKYIRYTLRSKTPIIAITENDPDQAKFQVKSAGCTDFLAKPYNIQDLIDKVEKYAN
jgi:CheY-like chemotaxis protein